MSEEKTIELKRETQVVRIPSGEAVTMPAGTPVLITQALGGSYTVVIPTQPGLYRIVAEDADAIGMEQSAKTEETAGGSIEDAIWGRLKTCYDPEIPVNIVDLGLIYDMQAVSGEEGVQVTVKMTLTAPGCGMGPVIADEAKRKILELSGVADAAVELVWEPAWSPEKISTEGKKKLGII